MGPPGTNKRRTRRGNKQGTEKPNWKSVKPDPINESGDKLGEQGRLQLRFIIYHI